MLDVIGSVFIGASLAAILVAVVDAVPLSPLRRLLVAGTGGAWIGLAGAIAGAGRFSTPPIVLTVFAAPLGLAAIVLLGWSTARRVLGAIPVSTLIGLNVVRLGGLMFVLLALAGRLAGPFPYIAGWGDFITGALALPVAWAVSRRGASHGLVPAWNAFGMLDLVVAVTLGLISRNGSPIQLIHAGAGTAAMQSLPWAFVPSVLVPFFLVVHAAIFARLAHAGRRDASTTGNLSPAPG